MMKYSIRIPKEEIKAGEISLAQRYDLNVSYKDLGAVCDAVRYMKASAALAFLEKAIKMEVPIAYRRHNKHMGSRHELGGKKGKYPVKASKEVRLAIINAIANAENQGNLDAENMYVIHSAANKTRIERRSPSKGSIAWGRGMYGRSAINHSDIEYAKVEIGIANADYKGMTKKMKYFIGVKKASEPKIKAAKQQKQKPSNALNSEKTKEKKEKTIAIPEKKEADEEKKESATSTK